MSPTPTNDGRGDTSPTAREYRLSYNLRGVYTGIAVAVLALTWGLTTSAESDPADLAPSILLARNGITALILVWMILVWVRHSIRRYYLIPTSFAVRGVLGRTQIEFSADTEFYHDIDGITIPLPLGGLESLLAAGVAGAFAELASAAPLAEEHIKHIHATVWRDGKSISIDSNVKRGGELRQLLIAAEWVHVLPKLQQDLKDGRRLEFGKKISLQGETVILGSRTASRTDVEASLSDGLLKIKDRGSGKRLFQSGTNRIPNVHCLIALLEDDHDDVEQTGQPI